MNLSVVTDYQFTADILVRDDGDESSLVVQVRSTSHPHLPVRLGYGLKRTSGILAQRLVRAIEAGAVLYDVYEAVDVHGVKYLACSERVMGRHLHADLKRLGF